MSSLRALSRSLSADEIVSFAGWSDRPWETYPALDVFALASESEGLPLSLLEAMASGCVPVATCVGGVPEVLSDPAIGWLVPTDVEADLREALIQATERVVSDRDSLAGRVRDHIRTRFNLGQQTATLIRLLETL